MDGEANGSIEEQLISLKSLQEQGLISDDEYAAKRKSIIDGIGMPPPPPEPRKADEWTLENPKKKSTKGWIIGLIVVLMIFFLINNGSDSDVDVIEPPSNRIVLDRIASLTDCTALQREFDTADANHGIQSELGNLSEMQLATLYMKAADERMRSVGCYG